MPTGKPIYVREVREDDVTAIAQVEEATKGVMRKDYWKKRLEISEAIRPHWTSIVAELDNRVVGFLLGRSGDLEFGLPGTVAWIEILGVHPAYRKRGVASKLVEVFADSAKLHGIASTFTLVSNGDDEMVRFFKKSGFTQGKMLHFQKG